MSFTLRLAAVEDAFWVHKMMLLAFEEYRDADVPSSALNETASFVRNSMAIGDEQAVLCCSGDSPIGSARFKFDGDAIYFSRLSVRPDERGRGAAKSILAWLEVHAKEQGKTEIYCRVRMSAPHNIQLYRSIGYQIEKEELVVNPNGLPVNTVVMRKRL